MNATVRYNVLSALRYGHHHDDPPGANRWNDDTATGPVVILLHGFGMDSATSWFSLSPLLAGQGMRVFTFDYGRYGHGWISRPRRTRAGLPGVGDAQLCADELERFIARVLDATGVTKVALVGHSFGALVAQYFLLRRRGADRVSHFVGIAPTVHGTTFNGLLRLPWADRLGARLVGVNIRQQAAGSRFLAELYADGELAPGVEYTVIIPRWDTFSTPVRAQALDGANNIRLRVRSEHVLVLYDRRALVHVTEALRR